MRRTADAGSLPRPTRGGAAAARLAGMPPLPALARRAAAAALLALLALPAFAGAAGPAPARYQAATFAVSLRGEQIIDWSYKKPQNDGCHPAITAEGSATIEFATWRRTEIVVAKSWRGRPGPSRRPVVAGAGGDVVNPGTRLSMTGVADIGAITGDCGDNGGGVPKGAGCGETIGENYLLDFEFKRKDRLTVRADAGLWEGVHGEVSGLSGVFQDCPFWWGGPGGSWEEEVDVAAGNLRAVTVKLPERKLFDPRRRRFVLKGSQVTCFEWAEDIRCGFDPEANPRDGGVFYGTMQTDWTLVLSRVKG